MCSAPSPQGGGQSREAPILSVNNSASRGGLTTTNFDHLPTASSSSSYQHNHARLQTPETDSGAPSPRGSHDDDPWRRKNLLTLDGGGIRGYSSLLLLRAVIEEIARFEGEEEPRAGHSSYPLEARKREPVRVSSTRTETGRAGGSQNTAVPVKTVFGPSRSSHYFPAHYFDYIAGTSTGGLIAIMLGRLVMTVDECLEAYENLADRVFGHPRILHIRRCFYAKDKYNPRHLEHVIRQIVQQRDAHRNGNAAFPQHSEYMCRTMLLAWEKRHFMHERKPYVLRSYRHYRSAGDTVTERNPNGADTYPIHQVGRATSAAPTYFKAVKLDRESPNLELIDGGFGANNPSEEAYREVGLMCNNNSNAVKILLSIGTGRNLEPDQNPDTSYALYRQYLNAAAKWASQSEGIHETMELLTAGHTNYYRLNVEEGLGKMKLDEWKGKQGQKTMEVIRAKSAEYLRLEKVQEQIRTVARELVEIRRARSSLPHRDHWERFCDGVEYECRVEACPRGRDRFQERQQLQIHIQSDHIGEYDLGAVEDLLDSGKRFPLYEVEPRDYFE